MATADIFPGRPEGPADAPAVGTVQRDRRLVRRWRERHALRQSARLISPRGRRVLAQWLRRTARDANDRDPLRRRRDVLLHYRAAAVRTELLELAALLEQAHDPDPDCVREVRELLANGDSPLYHPGVHVSELHATLYYLRSALRCRPGA